VANCKRGHPEQVLSCMRCLATLSPHVRTVNFCPSLFEKHWPYLSFFGGAKSCLIINCGEPVINNHSLLVPVNEQSDTVNSSIVPLLCQESCVNTLWKFSHRTENCQVVAVTKFTLVDVVWFYTSSKYLEIRLKNLIGAFPLILMGCCWLLATFLNRRLIRRKVWICPRLSFINNRLHEL